MRLLSLDSDFFFVNSANHNSSFKSSKRSKTKSNTFYNFDKIYYGCKKFYKKL